MTSTPLAVHTFEAAGDLPPVVLLHGFAASGAADYIATGWPTALTDAGRTVHVIDLPAHGDSPAVASVAEGTTTAVVAAIVAAIEATGASSVDVIGYSLGARLAWELPAAGVVRKLVLGGISPFEPFAMIDLDELRGVVAGTAEPTNPMTGMMAGMVQAPGCDSASLVNLIGGLGSEPFAPAAGAPTVPTLFVAGEGDMMTGGIEELVAAVPGAELVRVPGDHRGALDSPEFRAAALAFLA